MLRRLMDLLRGRKTGDRPAETAVDRDYAQERDNERLAGMSEEDREWGAASQQRDRDSRDRTRPSADR